MVDIILRQRQNYQSTLIYWHSLGRLLFGCAYHKTVRFLLTCWYLTSCKSREQNDEVYSRQWDFLHFASGSFKRIPPKTRQYGQFHTLDRSFHVSQHFFQLLELHRTSVLPKRQNPKHPLKFTYPDNWLRELQFPNNLHSWFKNRINIIAILNSHWMVLLKISSFGTVPLLRIFRSPIKLPFKTRRRRWHSYDSKTTHVNWSEDNAVLWINCQLMSIFTNLPEDQEEMVIGAHTEATMVCLFEAHHCTSFGSQLSRSPLSRFTSLSWIFQIFQRTKKWPFEIVPSQRWYPVMKLIIAIRLKKKSQLFRSIFKICPLLRMFQIFRRTRKWPFETIPR